MCGNGLLRLGLKVFVSTWGRGGDGTLLPDTWGRKRQSCRIGSARRERVQLFPGLRSGPGEAEPAFPSACFLEF